MMRALKTTKNILGMALLCTAMGSAAVTLGRLQGGATVGRPLDVQIQVTLDSNEDTSTCISADVSYGDTQIAPSQVVVRTDSAVAAPSTTTKVRVSSPVLVDEPIISLNLRWGCQQRFSRQYTLFADLPANPAALVTPAYADTKPAPAPVAQTNPVRGSETAVAPLVTAPRVAAAATARAAAPKTRPTNTTLRKPSARPRLQLDPLDLLLEQDPVLRVSNELLTLPQDDSDQRAQAAAWWRALNASPEEVLREAARLQNVQTEIQSLQTIATSNNERLNKLAEKVQRAESEKYANGLVYGLIALCVASLMGVGFLWRRLNQVQTPSWSQGIDAGDGPLNEPDPEPAQPVLRTATAMSVAAVAPVAELPEVDIDLDLSEPSKTSLPPPPRDFAISIYPSSRSMDTEELMDIRQQADFFMALEQHDKAIEVLSTRVSQCGESSPLICLDLLKIYHNLGRETEFEFLRTEFNHWFTGRVPEFAQFEDEGRGLETYTQVMDHIAELWPESGVLDYIENCIYHHSGEQQGADFDLLAYRELLLLHNIAKRIVRLAGGDEDEHLSEFMRIPASAPGMDDGETPGIVDSRAAAHRAGEHFRGSWNPGTSQEAFDPEAEVETRASPLGAMRVPAVAATDSAAQTPQDDKPELEFELEPTISKSRPTDFDFLNLR